MARPEVEAEIRAIAKRMRGKPTPEAVLEAARPRSSPLHPHFNWNLKEAALAYQLQQARELIASVRIEVRTTHYSVTVPAFVRDPKQHGRSQGYVSMENLQDDADSAREAVVNEFFKAANALSRAKAIALALELSEEIEAIQERIINLVDRAQRWGDDGRPAH